MARNLLPVTLGDIVGGAKMAGFVYWVIYRRDAPDAPASALPP
ncbi:MAG TPA: hypothetical protein VNU68_03430 [Verrucomicrobiae bacterium]|nr:hypothetical protein [Verrucomicrobiae bacterium]